MIKYVMEESRLTQIDELVQQKLYDEAISLLNQVDEVLLKNKVFILTTQH